MHNGELRTADPRRPDAPSQLLGTLSNPAHAEPCDLDSDGRLDLVVADLGRFQPSDHSDGKVVWLRQVADARWEPFVLQAGLGRVADVEPGDFDADGDLDIAVGRERVASWFDGAEGRTRLVPALRLFRNDGAGSFSEDTEGLLSPALTTEATAATLLGVKAMAAADLDGDGDVDLVLTGRETLPTDGAIPAGGRMATRILLNEGAAGLRDATSEWLSDADFLAADGVAVADLDGDGAPAVVLVRNDDAPGGARSLRILMNR